MVTIYKNPNGDYTKWVTIADKSERQLIEISHHTRRIFFIMPSLFKDKFWILDLLKDNLLEEKDAILGDMIDDPDEFEDDVEIGLGREMLGGN